MALPFRSTLRGSRYSASTILSTLSVRPLSPPQQQAAAIVRALHNTSRHSLRTTTRRLPQHHHQPRRPFSSSYPRKKPNSTPKSSHNTSNPTPPPPPSSEEASLSLSPVSASSPANTAGQQSECTSSSRRWTSPSASSPCARSGAETIGHYEHLAVGYVSAAIPEGVKEVVAARGRGG